MSELPIVYRASAGARNLTRHTTFAVLAATLAACSRNTDGAAASGTSASGPAGPLASPAASSASTGGVRADSANAQRDAGAAAAPSSAPVTDLAQAVAANADGGAADAALAERLRHFFNGYVDGSDFAFLLAACRPKLDQFISLRNVDAGAVATNARQFFAHTHKLAYEPHLADLRVERRPDGSTVARLPVRMTWTYPPNPDWPTGGDPWPAWSSETAAIDRDVTADAEITFDDQGKIARYVEANVRRPWLRVTGEDNCSLGAFGSPHSFLMSGDDGARMAAPLHKGQMVRDLGETFVTAILPRGPDIVRKVLVGNREGWADESLIFEVENTGGPQGASGGSECLRRVQGDAGGGGG